MTNAHEITDMSGRDLEERLNGLADISNDIDDEDVRLHKFYIKIRGKNFEICRIKFNPEQKRGYVKFSDGDRPSWKRLKNCLRDLAGQYKVFLTRKMRCYKKSAFTEPLFKTCILLLVEIAQSGFNSTVFGARYETQLAINAALKNDSCVADADDLVIFLAASRDDQDQQMKKTRQKAFERLML